MDRIKTILSNMPDGEDGNCTTGPIDDARKCCMCHQQRPAMRWVEIAWWCVPCHNQFTADMGVAERCEACNGDGTIEKPAPQRDDPEYASVVPCEACNGHGWL